MGSGLIGEHGRLHAGNAADEDEDITGSSETGTGASGSGSQNGATYWSYSGSGSYTDTNAGSGISFFLPGSASPTLSANVTGSAWASGSITGTISGSWSNSASSSASLSASGSGTTDLTFDNSASYSGSGSFTASGAVTGGGTIWEHGWLHTGNAADEDEDITGSSEVGEGASGSGSQSGATYWSYSGSGSYTDSNGASGIAFFLPDGTTPTISANVTGSAWASGSITGTISGSWSNTASGSASLSASGSGTTDLTFDNSASYSGSGSFTASGAVTGGGTIWEHGQLHTGNAADEDEDISGSSETGTGASGSGSQSGATYWSYSGSGSYTDSNGASGIAFFLPDGTTPTISANVTGSAWASGSITGTISGSWSNSASGSASLSASGSGTTDLTFDNSASYSGSGSFTLSGVMTGSGTITEYGHLHTGNADDEDEDISGSSETGTGASGSGSQSGATYWSYSGSGSYTDSNGASGIAFFLPDGTTPTISANVTGSAWASGSITGTISGSWSNSASGSGNLSASGSGSIDVTIDNSACYSGSGSFTATGAVSGSGTISEHGWQHTADNPVIDEVIKGASAMADGGTGSGSEDGSTFWSYSGSGSYTDANGTSGIAFFLPGSSSTPITVGVSGSVTGTAWASGHVNTTDQGSWTVTQNSSGVWTYSGCGTNTNNESNNASYSGGGSFWASGSASGGGTISESGHQNTSASYVNNNTLNGSSGAWALQSGSASGGDSGSTSWSYSGSASYNDSSIVGSISAFPVPFSGTPVNSGVVEGTTRTSGSLSTTMQGNWTASVNAGAWSYSGSGTTTALESASLSYADSGSFTQSMSGSGGAWLSASGTVSESGYSNTSAYYDKTFQLSGSGTWEEQSGSGSGTVTWCTGWSYTGHGTYSYPSSSGTITGTTSASGGQLLDPLMPISIASLTPGLLAAAAPPAQGKRPELITWEKNPELGGLSNQEKLDLENKQIRRATSGAPANLYKDEVFVGIYNLKLRALKPRRVQFGNKTLILKPAFTVSSKVSFIPSIHKDSKGNLVFIGDYDKAKGVLKGIAKGQGLDKFVKDQGNGNLSVTLQDGTVLSLTKNARGKAQFTIVRPKGARITIEVSEFYVSKHGEMPSPRPGLQSHHGVMSAWMKAHYPGYDPDKAPAVLMPAANHRATFGIFNKWKAKMAIKMGGKFDWSKVTEADIRALSEDMFDAAKVPAAIRRQYWAEYEKMKKALKK